MHSDRESEERNAFILKTMELAELSMQYMAPDIAADLMCLDFLHDSLPPVVSPENVEETVELNRTIRLVSKNSVRITSEGDSILFYYNTRNTTSYQEVEPQFIEFPIEASEALEYIINCYPKFISIEELPLEFDEDKIEVCKALLAAKIILIH